MKIKGARKRESQRALKRGAAGRPGIQPVSRGEGGGVVRGGPATLEYTIKAQRRARVGPRRKNGSGEMPHVSVEGHK